MKMIFVVYGIRTNQGKRYAIADTIKTGENLKTHCDRHATEIMHLCESRKQADETARAWNDAYKANGTYAYGIVY